MWLWRLLASVRRLFGGRRVERDLHDDVVGYADLMADELIASGVAPAEARRRARMSLGGVESVKESVRAVRTGAWLEQSWRDFAYGLRSLRRSPGFATTAVLTIGLGIGVNTTIFSVIDGALLKPLPYERPEELVDLGHHVRIGQPMETTFFGLDWPEIAEWRAEHAIFQGVEAYKTGTPRHWREADEQVRVGAFTAGLPALLGVKPRAGRLFTADEVAAGADVILIANALWTRAFGRRDDAIGSPMTIDGRRMTIIGVMPSTFRFGPAGGAKVMGWTPLAERAVPGVPGSRSASPLFRLRTGLSPTAAYPLIEAVAQRMQKAQPGDEPWKPELMPLDSHRQNARASVQRPMLLLFAAAGLVLLAACANVANVLLTRGAGRQEELAMRSALGASRGRLARLLLAESLAVALLGGVAAIALARWSLAVVVATLPARLSGSMFAVSAPELDWRVLLFALGATTLVALLSAVWPAVSASQVALRPATGSGGQTAGPARERRRIGRVLQAAQTAVALVLAITGALFTTSFVQLLATDLGFDPRGLGFVVFSLPSGPYRSDDAQRVAIAELLARARATPGVRTAAIGYSPPSAGTGSFVLPGATKASASSAIRMVGDGYFETAGIRIVAGRPIQPADLANSASVAVIDEVDARRVFGAASPLGRRFTYSPYVPELTIVGVASHVEPTDFTRSGDRVGVYLPGATSTNLLIRTDGDLGAVLKDVRASFAAFDPRIRIASSGPATDSYEEMETYSVPRFYVVLVSIFGVLGLVTSAVGLYGLLAHAVGQRRREIGVRVALGSTPGQVRALVMREALGPVSVGLAGGALAAWWVAGLLGSFLYGIGPRDPGAFALGVLALLVTTLLATIVPIRRATGVDPIVALRAE